MAGTMDKIKAKVDNVLHKDKTSDPTGPHDSHAANKADPRVDSDRIGTAGNTSGAGGVGAGQYGSSTHSGTGIGSNTHSGVGSTTHGHNDPTGPHSSHAANKLDPRVDSDRIGTAGNTAGAGGVGAGQYSGNTHSSGTGLGHNTHGHNDPTGPHSSHLANQADPRVDSDRYGTAGNTAGAGGVGAGQYGSNTSSGLTGSHGTHSGTGLTGSHQTGTVGSGNSNKTAGPHNSDLLNKVDPRVDSDLDGSKTVGGNATYH